MSKYKSDADCNTLTATHWLQHTTATGHAWIQGRGRPRSQGVQQLVCCDSVLHSFVTAVHEQKETQSIVQPVPRKMRLVMVIRMDIGILNGRHRSLFKKKPELWSSRILISIPMTISSLIFSGTGCIMILKKPILVQFCCSKMHNK